MACTIPIDRRTITILSLQVSDTPLDNFGQESLVELLKGDLVDSDEACEVLSHLKHAVLDESEQVQVIVERAAVDLLDVEEELEARVFIQARYHQVDHDRLLELIQLHELGEAEEIEEVRWLQVRDAESIR